MTRKLVALAGLICLTGCATLSTVSAVDTRPKLATASPSVKAGCADPVLIPKGVDQDDQWRLWGRDRRALADCKQRDAAKAAVIAAFETQGAR